jgi:ferredoxin
LSSALRHLGALGYLLFWTLAASGIYLYIRFDTSLGGAYDSIGELEWWFGGVLRSVHRYAADAFVVVTLAHLAKEWWNGRFRGLRAFSWLSGVPLVWLLYASGIVGYWLVWDARAQFTFLATLEALGLAPLGVRMSDRLFSFFVFLHIGLPLALLAGLWVHVQRLGRPDTAPPRALAGAALGALVVLALLVPAASEPAEPGASVAVDWFLLFAHPLMYATSPAVLWTTLGGLTLLLVALPYLAARPRLVPAAVDPANCNGCGRCVVDCPYEAVTLKDDKALVFAQRCAACGVCAGACPSSTPFRSVKDLVSGIDLPDFTVHDLRKRLQGSLPVDELVFSCRQSRPEGIVLRCLGQLPPSFIEYALRNGAKRVRAVGCEAECAYRLGMALADERFSRLRAPRLRRTVRTERLGHAYAFTLR